MNKEEKIILTGILVPAIIVWTWLALVLTFVQLSLVLIISVIIGLVLGVTMKEN